MKDVVDGTAVLPVSIIGGPSAASAARQLWHAGNQNARIGLLTPQVPGGPAESDPRLFHLTTSSPAEISHQIKTIAGHGGLDHLIVHCDEGQPIMAYASLFALENENSSGAVRLSHAAMAIAPTTVLDLLLPDRKGSSTQPVCFIVEQLEFAGSILLDPAADDSEVSLARAVLGALNPRATLPDLRGNGPSDMVTRISGETLDFAAVLDAAEWRRLIEEQADPISYPHGVTAFAYHARKPFHPERLWRLLQSDLRQIFRAKGFVWLATRMDLVGGLNLAGTELQCGAAGEWWATRDQETRDREMSAGTRKHWQEPFGDRRQAIALMTVDLEPAVVRAELDGCLLTDEEMVGGPAAWKRLADPFPSWSAHHHHHDHDCGHDHETGQHDHECDHDHGSGPHDCCRH
ncbi:MAG TPA: GTP-binding protein [Chthoniobacterales bacterium]|nr:GTP-binding protein [Chthoniobacterales bacterium]